MRRLENIARRSRRGRRKKGDARGAFRYAIARSTSPILRREEKEKKKKEVKEMERRARVYAKSRSREASKCTYYTPAYSHGLPMCCIIYLGSRESAVLLFFCILCIRALWDCFFFIIF